jgi:ribulose-5-phosphate 4-epimerase/fuculose-1-phosphate aldolase
METHDNEYTPEIARLLDRLATGCQILEMEGHGDKTLGHVAFRDPLGRGFWMKRFGIGLREVCSHEDFILLDFDGEKLAGQGGRHSEWAIHSGIFRSRPDINAIGHTHPFYGAIFAAANEPLWAIAQEACYLGGDVPRYRGTSSVVNTRQLGDELAARLGGGKAVIQQNHGVTFVGHSIDHMVLIGLFFEKACHQQFILASSGFKYTVTPEEELKFKGTVLLDSYLELFFGYYARKLAGLPKPERVPQVSEVAP